MAIGHCPACGGTAFQIAVPQQEIRGELDAQRHFVFSRLARKAGPAELKDLTDFMHGVPAPLVECTRCGLLHRQEDSVRDAGSYEDDPNDSDLMAQLYPRYLQAFRDKRGIYEPLLQPHASVLEIGSHLGAFLQTAEEWNWRPAGVDVGKDTSEFASGRGFTVARELPDEFRAPEHSLDGVFVWNCFEQILDPMPALAAIRRMLKRHGLLVIRVPNAGFYLARRRSLNGEGKFIRSVLHYNNLAGFPYLYGYTIRTLNRVMSRAGFAFELAIDSELLTIPFPDLSWRIVNERTAISRWIRSVGADPWVEAVYRKAPDGSPTARVSKRCPMLRAVPQSL